ncbi:MAG: nuclear transport factor 2 family protein [Geminicoccaceae bacterium]
MTIEAYIEAFENLEPATLDRLMDRFSTDARFADPFNDVTGRDAIRRVFERMFEDVDDPRFVVTGRAGAGDTHYLRWHFTCRPKGFLGRSGDLVIDGMSEVRLDSDGRVCLHVDHWDAARQLYEHVPVLGSILGILRRKLGISSTR